MITQYQPIAVNLRKRGTQSGLPPPLGPRFSPDLLLYEAHRNLWSHGVFGAPAYSRNRNPRRLGRECGSDLIGCCASGHAPGFRGCERCGSIPPPHFATS